MKCYENATEETVKNILDKLRLLKDEDDTAFISDFNLVKIDLNTISKLSESNCLEDPFDAKFKSDIDKIFKDYTTSKYAEQISIIPYPNPIFVNPKIVLYSL